MFSFGVKSINKSHLLTTATALTHRESDRHKQLKCVWEKSVQFLLLREWRWELCQDNILFTTSPVKSVLSDSQEDPCSVLRALVSEWLHMINLKAPDRQKRWRYSCSRTVYWLFPYYLQPKASCYSASFCRIFNFQLRSVFLQLEYVRRLTEKCYTNSSENESGPQCWVLVLLSVQP